MGFQSFDSILSKHLKASIILTFHGFTMNRNENVKIIKMKDGAQIGEVNSVVDRT